jgi:hypothetical protein
VGYYRATRLEPDFSATDGTADVSEDEEDDADDEHDGADRVEETDAGQPTEQKKYDPKDDHSAVLLSMRLPLVVRAAVDR